MITIDGSFVEGGADCAVVAGAFAGHHQAVPHGAVGWWHWQQTGMNHDTQILASLATADSVQLYYACKKVVQSHSQRVAKRLIEILDDPTDWDCGHYPAVEALKALTRIDRSGWCWLEAAGKAFGRHIDNEVNLATSLFDIVRWALPVGEFLSWANQVVPESARRRADEPWIVTILRLTGSRWLDDDHFIEALLAHLDEADRLAVIGELHFCEEGYRRLARQMPGTRLAADADRLARWTKDAPPQIRDAVRERLG